MSNQKTPDFSNVQSDVSSTGEVQPDFGNVKSSVESTGEITGGGGGSGGGGEQTYTVAGGDSLSKIAKQFYGNANKWARIYDANRDQLSDPDKIFPGQVLRIPAPDSDPAA